MTDPTGPNSTDPSARGPGILIVDDDRIFRDRLGRAMAARGLSTHAAGDAAEAVEQARRHRPDRAVVDLRMPGAGGLDLVRDLVALDPAMRVVVLTGYGSIASAVEAVRRGATDYLTKPVDADQILAAFETPADPAGPADAATPAESAVGAGGSATPSLARVEYEHIQRILADCGGNVSHAARKLGIHRRSLQRKLHKLPPLE